MQHNAPRRRCRISIRPHARMRGARRCIAPIRASERVRRPILNVCATCRKTMATMERETISGTPDIGKPKAPPSDYIRIDQDHHRNNQQGAQNIQSQRDAVDPMAERLRFGVRLVLPIILIGANNHRIGP